MLAFASMTGLFKGCCVTDDNDALTLRNGRISLRLMFSRAPARTRKVYYWLQPLHDGQPMFPDHWFRRLDQEIAYGQPPGSIFASDDNPWLTWAIQSALDRGKVGRWQSLDVSALIVPGGRDSCTLSDQSELAEDWFDVIFAFHAARAGDARWNCHDAGPCLRLSVPREMLERFCRALGNGLMARQPPDPYELLDDDAEELPEN